MNGDALENVKRLDQALANEQMAIFLKRINQIEFAEDRRLDGVYELVMSQMIVNACSENYSWIQQSEAPIGLGRGIETNSSILVNLPGLYEVNLAIIFPDTWYSSNNKAQP